LDFDETNGWIYGTLALLYADEEKYDSCFHFLELAIKQPDPYPIQKEPWIDATWVKLWVSKNPRLLNLMRCEVQ
ncbi:MAG: hypothetical protein AAF399_05990, partial [Bacteroidota bacterium]